MLQIPNEFCVHSSLKSFIDLSSSIFFGKYGHRQNLWEPQQARQAFCSKNLLFFGSSDIILLILKQLQNNKLKFTYSFSYYANNSLYQVLCNLLINLHVVFKLFGFIIKAFLCMSF